MAPPATRPATIVTHNDDTVTLRVPMAFARHGGRKVIIAPDVSVESPGAALPLKRIDNTMVKALARAFRWQRLLDTGDYGSIAELADSESLNRSYVSRILRLTLLAPDIVEAILDGRQSEQLTLKAILEPFTAEWARQRELLVS